jgi:hypothetical protein
VFPPTWHSCHTEETSKSAFGLWGSTLSSHVISALDKVSLFITVTVHAIWSSKLCQTIDCWRFHSREKVRNINNLDTMESEFEDRDLKLCRGYQHISWSSVLVKLIVTQLPNKYTILWKLKVGLRVYKSLLVGPILSQTNPVHTPSPSLFNAHFNVTRSRHAQNELLCGNKVFRSMMFTTHIRLRAALKLRMGGDFHPSSRFMS